MNNLVTETTPVQNDQQSDWIQFAECNREDGNLFNHEKCRDWLGQVRKLLAEKIGTTPKIRLHCYQFGDGTYFAIDAFDQSCDGYVAITILIEQGCLDLRGPVENQIDITLPGIVDCLSLVKVIADGNLHATGSPNFVWIAHEDRPIA